MRGCLSGRIPSLRTPCPMAAPGPSAPRLGPLPLSPKGIRLWWFGLAVVGFLRSCPPSAATGTIGPRSGRPGGPWEARASWTPSSTWPGRWRTAYRATTGATRRHSRICTGRRRCSPSGSLSDQHRSCWPWWRWPECCCRESSNSHGTWTVRLAFAWTPDAGGRRHGPEHSAGHRARLWAIGRAAPRQPDRDRPGRRPADVQTHPGLPLLAFLLLRGFWRSASIASLVVAAGYVLSVAAAAGDWLWPVAWWNGIQPYLAVTSHSRRQDDQRPRVDQPNPRLPSWLAYLGGARSCCSRCGASVVPRLSRLPAAHAW